MCFIMMDQNTGRLQAADKSVYQDNQSQLNYMGFHVLDIHLQVAVNS